MAEDREKLNIDFGIEETLNAGSSELVNSLLGGFASANPDDIQPNARKQKSSTTETTTTKAVANKAKSPKEEEDDFTFNADDVDILGEEEDEEGSSSTTETTTKAPIEDANEGGEGDENEDNTLSLLGQDLLKTGIFTKDDDESDETFNFKDPKDLLARFQYEKKKGVQETLEAFLSRYGDDYAEMFDAVFVNGVHPKEYLGTFTKLQDLANLDLSLEANQKRVVREYLIRQGFVEDKADARVQKTALNGDLEEDATQFQAIMVEQDAKELQVQKETKEKQILAQRRTETEFAQNVNKILNEKLKEKEFDGVPLSAQIAQKAYSFLNDKKYKLSSGEQLTEFDKFILELKRPENHAVKVKLALLALDNFDLSKVKVKERNDKTTELFGWAAKNKANKKAQVSKTVIADNKNFI